MAELWLGDCLELMPQIADQSVDLILCDLPYQVSARYKWDILIPFEPLWQQYRRILKHKGTILLFATEPFRTQLISSNFDMFKYDLIWEKNKSTGFLNAKKQPLRKHESILVFYKKLGTYNPQKSSGHTPVHNYRHNGETSYLYGKTKPWQGGGSTERYPTSILKFNVVNNDNKEKIHESQKPVQLLEYLIQTYSNKNDLVLDNCSGSGSTLVAAKNTGRQFIGIEKEITFYEHSKKRLNLIE